MSPNPKTGVPTEAVMVTVCVAVLGPLHPAAVAVIMEVPLHPASYETSPVKELIVFPALKLVASNVYVIPVAFDALALYVTFAIPWHRVEVEPNAKTGVPTVGVIVTVCDADVGPLHPLAVAVIVEVPVQLAV